MDEKVKYEKIIIINWRFKKKYRKEWDVKNKQNYKVICLNYKSAYYFNNRIKDLKSNNYLMLLHDNPPHKKVNISVVPEPKKNFNVKKRSIKGGSEPVYVSEDNPGFLGGDCDLDSSCLDDNDKIKINNFNNVWNYYWKNLDLEIQKKIIINLWLPLAIDIQGLSEVKDNNKIRESYFDDIKKFYEENPISHSKADEISNSIENRDITSLIKNCKIKCKEIETDITSNQNDIDKFYYEYIKKSSNFFPSLLQKLVEKIDQQINQD